MGLNLPADVRQQAFKAFCLTLQNDPVLRREVKSWRIWDGSHKNEQPTVDTMPCVQLRMLGGSIERGAGNTGSPNGVALITKPTVAIDLWTAGMDAGDLLNLYDAIDLALFPRDDGEMAVVQERFFGVGIMDVQPVKDVLPEGVADYTAESIHGAGAYQLTLVLDQ